MVHAISTRETILSLLVNRKLEPMSFCHSLYMHIITLSLMVVCKYIQSTYWLYPWLFTWPDYEDEMYEEEEYEFDDGEY